MLYVGIDWARSNHRVALVNSSGELLESFSAPHSGQGFHLIRDRIEHCQQEPSAVRVAIELPRRASLGDPRSQLRVEAWQSRHPTPSRPPTPTHEARAPNYVLPQLTLRALN